MSDRYSPEQRREHNQRYYAKNAVALRADAKIRVRKRYWDNPEKARAATRAYQAANMPAVMKRQAEWERRQRATNPAFKVKNNLRKRLNRALRGHVRTGSSISDLGCSVADLILWLEGKFAPWMSWGNYGTAWNIDHVRALSEFDLTNRSQVKEACHYTNLQPLSVLENIRKGGKRQRAATSHTLTDGGHVGHV